MRSLPVRFLDDSWSDFEQITLFLQANGASVTVTARYIQRIVAQCEKIGLAPERYALREEIGSGIRVMPFEHSAKITYRVRQDAVEIVNIYYGGRDL